MGEHPKLMKFEAGPGDTYWFPDEGKTLEDVTVTVHWSVYSDGQLRWAIRPFAPVDRYTSAFNPVQYPGRTHAATKREAARIAAELFTISVVCLRLDHDDCGGHLANLDDWPDAPACACSCHKPVRP